MASSFGTMLRGSGLVNDTRACTIRRVAPTKSAPALKMVFTDCSRPNSRNAMITDSKVRMVRVRLRNRLAMTKPLRVMASPARPLSRLLEELALLQMQGAPREPGGLGLVVDDHDLAGGRLIQTADQIEQRRLARARRSHQRDEVAAGNVQSETVQDFDLLLAALVHLGDAADLNHGLGHSNLSS